MADNCCLDQWRETIVALATTCGCAGETASSTFTLYRRALKDVTQPPRDDLGLETRPTKQDFAPVVTDEPCIFSGTNPKREGWQIFPEGQFQIEEVMLFTAYTDIREGDNLVLAADGKSYLVQASTYVGPLRRCFLNSAKAQL